MKTIMGLPGTWTEVNKHTLQGRTFRKMESVEGVEGSPIIIDEHDVVWQTEAWHLEAEVGGFLRTCQECGEEVFRDNLMSTCDRYGIPFKTVCPDCFDAVQAQIDDWCFDPSYAGESLE